MEVEIEKGKNERKLGMKIKKNEWDKERKKDRRRERIRERWERR